MSDTKIKTNQINSSKEGLAELKDEIDNLTNVKLPKVIIRVANAREQGDLSENADYQSARDEQTFIQARVIEIEEIIARSKVVKNTKSLTTIGMGSTVEVIIKGKAAKKFTYHIVGEFESDPAEGKVSSSTPMGSAMMGKKKGDEITVHAPAGDIKYVIKDIK